MRRGGGAVRLNRRALLGSAAGALVLPALARAAPAPAPRTVTQRFAAPGRFAVGCDTLGITSLTCVGDTLPTDYVASGSRLGVVEVAWRQAGGAWQRSHDATATIETARLVRIQRHGAALTVTSTLRIDGVVLRWEIAATNTATAPIEIGDLALPLPMPTRFAAGQPEGTAVLKHSFVSGHGSHIFWMRKTSTAPHLALLPARDTPLEYWDTDESGIWRAYIHASAAMEAQEAKGGRWRLPITALTLAPGETRRYAFAFHWAEDYAALRTLFADAGLIDVEAIPGLTIPGDLDARIALRSADAIEGIDAEYPDATHIERLPDHAGYQHYRIRFDRLGENRLALRQAGGRVTWLEFFATEPVETLIAKRAAFIAGHRHTDPAKWYRGLLAEWNMADGVVLGPDNYDRIKGWRIYEVTCDDPGLSKPAFLAGKNAEFAVQAEIDALDDYVEHFVWGGLQRTIGEDWPFGLYGIPDWKTNRDSPDAGKKGKLHIWRPYDYPHIVALYFGLYRVAREQKGVKTRLPAATYLDRAYGTACAMFTIPKAITDWSADETGFYNELLIVPLIDALVAAGRGADAATLRGHWERKVRTFVLGKPDLFQSEYAFDSTGFESTGAIARYALDHGAAMGVPAEAAARFRDTQLAANLFCRGWLEPAYYLLGSDYRPGGGDAYTLSYMAQMGGWAILDHALHDATDPHPLLRLGYASALSSWALINSGTPESGYGYWYPGKAHDGAAAGGFEPAASGMTWLDQPHHRGAWYYSCEIDLGFCGALRAAATIVADDPVFGRVCHGGDLRETGVVPRDGVRRRLHVRLGKHRRTDIELVGARFARDAVVTIDAQGVGFTVERFSDDAHALVGLGPARRRVPLPLGERVALSWPD